MIKLKEILQNDGGGITTRDIFNFYFLFTVSSYHPEVVQSNYGKYIQDTYLKGLKNKYVHLFKQLVSEQLMKYYKRGRVESDFDISKVTEDSPASTLLELMKKTYRSDMVRRNDVWIQACEFLVKLENSSTNKEIYLYIDRLNSVVHNTQSQILGKVSYDLVHAYDKVHKAKSVRDYQQFVDSDLRQLMNQDELKEGFKRTVKEAGKDDDFYDAAFGVGKKITPSTPKGFSPTPRIKPDKPKDDDDDDDKKPTELDILPLQEALTEAHISPEDKENIAFMTGLKLGIQDKNADNKRDLKGYPDDFVRGYKMVARDSWWHKFNDRLTRWAADLGKSYGHRR